MSTAARNLNHVHNSVVSSKVHKDPYLVDLVTIYQNIIDLVLVNMRL